MGGALNRHGSANPSAMQKVRVRYAKRGRLRFASHRDVARAFERGLRRAEVPMAHSRGFSPHPKISWLGAAPTGAASEAEYVELQLESPMAPAQLAADLRVALIPGLDVLEAVEAGPEALSDQLQASRWRVELPGVPVHGLRAAVRLLLAAGSVEVQRMTKNGLRSFDARAALLDAEVTRGPEDARGDVRPKNREPYGILGMVVRHTTPVVRPDDVLNALRVVADLALPATARAVRLEQGRLDDEGGLVDPFARDRATAGARRGDPRRATGIGTDAVEPAV